MPTITRPTVQLSLVVTPPAARARDEFTIRQRVALLEQSQEELRELALFWAHERVDGEGFSDFEAKLIERMRAQCRAATELMLAMAEGKSLRERPGRFETDGVEFRQTPPEPRSLNTWFGPVRYSRSYARPVDGGPGWFPLDADLNLLGDRISPSLLMTGARLATRTSFAEAREILGWFVPQPPSTEVLEQTVLGLGHHTADWFASVAPPEDDGEVLIVLVDGKCVPTARASELKKRRGSRKDKPKAPSPRHRGRIDRKARRRRRPKKGDKSKNGKLVTTVVMYTLRKEGNLLLGPLNRRVYASFGPKRHAFEFAAEEAARRGFSADTDCTIQVLTDGDPDLHRYVDEYFPAAKYANRVVTVDVMHVLEKLWDAGRSFYDEGSDELAAWVDAQEDRMYDDDAEAVITELRDRLERIAKTGPGNKGRRARIQHAIRYLSLRLHKLDYGTYRARDLEVGTGQVEGAIKYVISKRCDHGGMRWKRERAQAIIQLRCIDVNGNWDAFTDCTLRHLRARALGKGCRIRLQTQSPAALPTATQRAA